MSTQAADLSVDTWALRLHLAAVVASIPLGAWQLARPKGTAAHRVFGWVWAGIMGAVTVTSFGLRDKGQKPDDRQFGGRYREGGKYRADSDAPPPAPPRGLAQYTGGQYTYGLSPVHLASAYILVQVPRGILAAKNGNIPKHSFLMKSSMALLGFGAYFFGLTTAVGITERIRV